MNALQETLVCPDVLRLGQTGPMLFGNRCNGCGEVFFPGTLGCTRCGSRDLEEYCLGNHGSLWSWTLQEFPPKAPYNGGDEGAGFRPFGVGYVEMLSGIKVESRLLARSPNLFRIGIPMRLVLEAYRGTEAGPLYTYAFEAIEGEAP